MTPMTRRTSNRTPRTLQREVDDLFDQFFDRTDGGDRDTSPEWSPSTDLVETDDAFRLRLDVPGMSADDIRVNLQNHTLTVSGKRTSERTEEGEGVVRMERAVGTFHRTFTLPNAADADSIEATCDNGVLTIRVPKTEESTRRRIEIE